MPTPSQLDASGDVIRQLVAPTPRRQTMLDAAKSLSSDSEHAEWMAQQLLKNPAALREVDQFVGDHSLQITRPLGSGAESLVWEVQPVAGPGAHVLKVRHNGMVDDFDLPENVPGVVPYWAKAQAGPDVAMALQQKADAVYQRGLELPFSHAADRLGQSLLARGWYFGDGHKHNVGLMPGGNWAAIDGFIDRAHPSWTLPKMSAEEAIRMLRATPYELEDVKGFSP